MLYDQWSTHNFEKILYFTENLGQFPAVSGLSLSSSPPLHSSPPKSLSSPPAPWSSWQTHSSCSTLSPVCEGIGCGISQDGGREASSCQTCHLRFTFLINSYHFLAHTIYPVLSNPHFNWNRNSIIIINSIYHEV